MTQERQNIRKMAEFSALFLTLDKEGQDCTLAILRSLGYAQAVMCSLKQSELSEDHISPQNSPQP